MVIITVKREQTQSINKIWINFLHVGPAEKTLLQIAEIVKIL